MSIMNDGLSVWMIPWQECPGNHTLLEIVGGGPDRPPESAKPLAEAGPVRGSTLVLQREPLRAGITGIPFPDRTFESVICRDALSRIRAEDRPMAIAEIIRVAKRECFFLEPHCAIAFNLDKGLAEALEGKKIPLPGWLTAHLHNGLPALDETVGMIQAAGYVPEISCGESIFEHCASLPPGYPAPRLQLFRTAAENKGAAGGSERSNGDVPYSLSIRIDKNRPVQEPADPFAPLLQGMRGSAGLRQGARESEVDIFAVYHKPAALLGRYRMIQAFAVNASVSGADIFLECPVGFFEEHNGRCSEISAIHYAWRNRLYRDIVGFCHYRRYLWPFPEDTRQPEIRADTGQMAALLPRIEDRDRILSLMDDHEVLTARPIELGIWRQDDQYAVMHFPQDYYAMVECLVDGQPYLGPALQESMKSTSLHAANMIVCGGELFDVFCRVWFDLLACCAGKLDPSGRNPYQARDIAFLSERIFDTLIRHLKRLGYRVCELPKVLVKS